MVSITVSAAGHPPSLARGLPLKAEIPGKDIENATIGDIKSAVAAKFPKFYVSRQKIALKADGKALADDATLHDVGIVDGGEVTVKDLGPQISWGTVFIVEYAGPLIIHFLVYNFPEVFFGTSVEHSLLQRYVYVMVMLHFAKRELETIFVHRFSHATMPVWILFKNSAHYYILSGIFLAYSVYSPTYAVASPYIKGTQRDNPTWLLFGVTIWVLAELSNLSTHITLRNLRPAGTRKRAIPQGYGFSLVSCPNYLFEIQSWVVISILTGSWTAWFFTAVSTAQMTIWALKKHGEYKKQFGNDYPKGRKALVPFIL